MRKWKRTLSEQVNGLLCVASFIWRPTNVASLVWFFHLPENAPNNGNEKYAFEKTTFSHQIFKNNLQSCTREQQIHWWRRWRGWVCWDHVCRTRGTTSCWTRRCCTPSTSWPPPLPGCPTRSQAPESSVADLREINDPVLIHNRKALLTC